MRPRGADQLQGPEDVRVEDFAAQVRVLGFEGGKGVDGGAVVASSWWKCVRARAMRAGAEAGCVRSWVEGMAERPRRVSSLARAEAGSGVVEVDVECGGGMCRGRL
jgi:hypothetical protein